MNNPLPAPVPRKRQHTRTIECNGYLRADGLYDVEGRLVDVKSISFHNMDRGDVKPGEPIHEMWIRLAATTVWGPYNMCGDIAPAFKCLKGLTIGPGWTRKTRELLAGIKGCTHMVELLGPVATTAFQTIYADRVARDKREGRNEKPALIGSNAPDSPVVAVRHPEHYTGPKISTDR